MFAAQLGRVAALLAPRVAPTRAAAPAGTTTFATYTKQRIRARGHVRNLKRKWISFNEPRLVPKYLRHAERVALQLGVVDDVKAFDEAAAAFPNAPPLVAATLLERSNVIMRDIDEWEGKFLQLKHERNTLLAKAYPVELLDQWTAGDKVLETDREGAGGGAKKGPPGGAAKAGGAKGKGGKPGAPAEGAEGEEAAGSGPVKSGREAATAPVNLADFFEKGGPAAAATDEAKGLAIAPRESSADTIGDKRSLERAYAQRLVLVVRDKESGAWGVPSGARLEGEPLRQAAERSLRAHFGADPSLRLWYVGASPVGHWLRVYSPEQQAALGCYGEKVFYYRAEIMGGRFRLPAGDGGADSRSAEAFPYDDFMWLTRDECEGAMSGTAEGGVKPEGRALWKYLHQVIGGGAGEEFARQSAWKTRLAPKTLSIAQGTGRRAHRVQKHKETGLRLPAVATREAAALAASPWDKEGRKSGAMAAAAAAYYGRVAASKTVTALLHKQLNTPSQRSIALARLTASRGAAPRVVQP